MTLLLGTTSYTRCSKTKGTPVALSVLPTKAIIFITPRDHGVSFSEEVRTVENQSRAVTNITGLLQGLR